MPFQPTDPIVAMRDTDPDVDDLVPTSEMHMLTSSRYERNSGGLPRLGDDPEWAPPGTEFVSSIVRDEPRRWFWLFRR